MRNILAPNELVSEMWTGRKLGQRFQLAFLNLYFSVCMLRCLSIKIAGMLQGKLISKSWRLCIFWQFCISWIISFPQAFIFWLWRWFTLRGALLVLCGNRLQSSLALGTADKLFVCEELICLWPAAPDSLCSCKKSTGLVLTGSRGWRWSCCLAFPDWGHDSFSVFAETMWSCSVFVKPCGEAHSHPLPRRGTLRGSQSA